VQALSSSTPFWLAPMAGYTDQAMRKVFRRFGGGLFFTEVTVAQGIVRNAAPSWHLLSCDTDEHPVAGHIYGADPAAMAEAAQMLEAKGCFAAIDINCGCPVRKIVSKGAGAALIRDPKQIGAIVEAVSSVVKLPVTVKTRIGYDLGQVKIMEILSRVENGGAAALTIHGRFADQHHKGRADWDLIGNVKERASIPIIGNGGIKTARQAVDVLRRYGVDAVMLARGAVGNPWILSDAEALLHNGPIPARDYAELREVVHLHLDAMLALKQRERLWRRRASIDADRAAALQFRCHLMQYLAGLEHWADMRRRFSTLSSCEEVRTIVDTVISRQTRPWSELYPVRNS